MPNPDEMQPPREIPDWAKEIFKTPPAPPPSFPDMEPAKEPERERVPA